MGLSDSLERVTEEGPQTTNEDSNLLRHGDAPARLSLTDEDRLNGWRDGVTSTGRRYFYHSSDLSNAVWAGEESHAAKQARLKAAEEAEDRAREEKALGLAAGFMTRDPIPAFAMGKMISGKSGVTGS